MRRTVIIVGLILVLGLVVAVVGTVQAQNIDPVPVQPRLCYVAAHDLNGDGRVNELDMKQWKDWLLHGTELCHLGAAKEDCHPGMDINGDGVITFDDLNIMLARYRECVMAPRLNTQPQG
jgi:hypothetical protein